MNIGNRAFLRVVVMLATAAVSCTAFGTTKTFTAGGGAGCNGNECWSDPLNWSPNGVPGSGDDVIVPHVGTGTLDFNISSATINSIVIQNAQIVLIHAGADLTVNNASTVNAGGTLLLNSSNFDGAGSLQVNGTVEIFGGTLDGPGSLTIGAGGLLEFWGSVNSSRLLRSTTNNGRINFLNSIQPGNHFGFGNGNLDNFGIIDIRTDHDINNDGGSPVLSNHSGGLIKKSAGSGSAAINFPVDHGSGAVIDVDTGTLVLTGGGLAHGTYSIASGATLNLSSGTFTTAGSPTLTGPGTFSIASGATFDVNAGTFTMSGNPTVSETGLLTISGGTLDAGVGVDVTLTDVNVSAGSITGAGAVRVGGNFNWSGGTITGSGLRVLTSTSNPRFEPAPLGCLLDGATLQVQASGTFDQPNAIVFSNGANLTIDPGKTLSVTNDGDITSGSGGGSIINNGTIWKKTTSGTSTLGVPVTLSGTSTAKIDSGTLQFGGGASVASGAIVDVAAGQSLEVTGGVFLFNSGAVSMPGSGNFKISSGTLRVPTGVSVVVKNMTLQGSGVVDGGGALLLFGTNSWAGGTMGSATAPGGITQVNSGVDILNITAGGAQSLTQSRELINNGTVNYGGTTSNPLTMSANGKITNNNAFNLTADGNINLSGGALIDNHGAITKSGGTGTSTISPPLDNNSGPPTVNVSVGTLALAGGGTERGGFHVASGATLAFSGGTFTMLGTPSVAGPGALSISGATIDVGDGPGGSTDAFASTAPTTFASGTINVKDATLDVAAAFSVSGTIELFGGRITGAVMTINSGGVLNCRGTQSAASIAVNTTVNSGGRINYPNNVLGCGLSGNITVTNNGTIDFQSDAGLASFSGAPQLVNNTGTIQKSAGSLTSGITVPVTANSGSTLQSSSGTLSFIVGGNFTDVTISGSGIVLLAAASSVSGTTTLTGTLKLVGNSTLAGTLNASGTLLLDNGVDVTWPNVTLSAAGSKIDGAGTLHVSGNFTWAGGTITGSGPRVMDSTSVPAISCSASPCTLDGGTLRMQAHGTYSASSNALVFSNGGSLILDPGKLLFVTNDGDFTAGSGGGSITIGGFSAGLNAAIEKNTTAGTSVIGVPVTMSGSFKVDAGTLQVAADVTAASGAIVHYSVGGTIELTGGVFLFNSSSISFPANGDFKVSGGTVRVPTGVSISPKNVTLQGTGVIDGGGTLILSGTSTWSAGTMGSATAPGGITQIDSGNTLNIGGSSLQFFTQNRQLLNNGTVNYSGSSVNTLMLSAGSKITNNAAFHLTGDRNIDVSGGATIDNNGTLDKSGGSGTSALFPPVNNAGTVSATSGTLVLVGGGTSSGGSFAVTAPATLSFLSGTHSMSGGGSISGTGTLSFDGGTATIGIPVNVSTLNMNAGTATLNANASADAFTMTGGTIAGSGTLTLNNGGSWSGGTMSGSGMTIIPAAKSLNMSSPAVVTLNRTLQNDGTLNVNGDVSGSGTIANNGTLDAVASASIGPVLNNNGQAAISNVLTLSGGGTSNGSFTVTAPGILALSAGTYTITGGSISGTGTLSINGANATISIPVNVGALSLSGGSATLNANGSANQFTMIGATLGGSGTLTLNNGGTWTGGMMSGSGMTIIPAAKNLNIPAPSLVTLNRTLQNNGTLSVSGTVAGSGLIDNQATINVIGNSTIGAMLNNSGQVTTSSLLTLSGGGTSSGGSFIVTAPGNFSFSSGTHSMSGGGSISGTGTLSFGGATVTVGIPLNVGTLNMNSGTATLDANGSADAFGMTGGTLGGSGILTLNNGGTWSGGTMSGSGTTINPATKTLGISAPVTLNSRTLQNSGTLSLGGDVLGSGTIDNQGMLDIVANTSIGAVLNNNGQVAISNVLTLNGGGTNTGSLAVTAPGILAFSAGTYSITGGSISGTGTLSFTGANATSSVPINVGALSLSGGSATLNANGSANQFTMIGATLGGSGTLTLNNGGTWTGGTMSGSGMTIVPPAKSLNLSSPSLVTLNRTLQNDGTLNVNGDVSGSGTIANNGTISAVANRTISAGVNNSGQVTTSSVLSLAGGGTHSGTFTATAPAGVIDFSGGAHTISGPFAGTGTFRFSGGTETVNNAWSGKAIDVAGGSVAFNTGGSIPALNLSGGTLAGSGGITVTGPSTWSGGTIAGSGALTFDTGAIVTMPGMSSTTLARPLLNNGTINFTAASSAMIIDGVPITNNGTLDIQSASQDILVTAGTPPFVNSGTLKKSAGAGAVQFAAPLMNTGAVEIDAGTLNFSGTYAQSAGTTDVRAGATLQTATLALNGGSLIGNGTIAGAVDNHAVVAPGASPGTLTINGDYVQASDGTLDIQLGGTAPGTQYDRLLVSGTVTLGGTLNVSTINSFVPAIGNAFQIFTYGARSNLTTFAAVNGLDIDATTVLAPIYGVNDLQLLTNTVQADLFASVSAPLSAANGSAFAYTVNIFNKGGSNATGVNFTATLPANVTFNSASPAICSGAPNLVCTIGALANQSTALVVLNVTANGAGAAPVSVITGGNEPDPNSANNTASASTSIGNVADLHVTATGTASTLPGSRVIYTITITNGGPDAATNVSVGVSASPGLTFSGNSGTCAGSFPCTLAALSSGESATIVSAWDISTTAAGSVQLTVNATSAASDPNPPDNSASVTTLIGTCPAITIGAPAELRSGSSAAAVATPFAGAVYNWSISNGTIDSGAGTNNITFTAGAAGTAMLAVQVIGGGCTLSATFPVTVKPRQTCVGTATPSEPAAGTTTADAMVTFRWNVIEGASGYRLWLQQGDTPAQNLGTAIDTSLTRVIPPGAHRWYVETLFDGCASHESDHVALTILPAQDCASNGGPQLSAPANDTTATSATVAFSWNAVAKAMEYELWLAPSGGVPTLIRTTAGTSYTATVPPGRLEWYVRAIFGGCAATESAHRTFTYTLPPDCTSQRPLLIAPADGERLTSPVSFEWRTVSGASSYELFIDGVLAATTTSPHASGIAVPLNERRWQVRARLGEGCGALDSAEGRFAVIAPPSSCTPLDAPVVTAPGQISSGVTGRIQWTFVAGATSYVVEISTDSQFSPGATSSSIVTTRELPFTFTNESSAPTVRYVRVHAVDTKCVVQGSGPFSPVAVLSVLPRTGSNAVALLSDPADVQYALSIAADLAGSSFSAEPTVPWITVIPASGVVPPGGLTLHATAHTADLPAGASTGSVVITTTSAAGTHMALGNAPPVKVPITVNNIPGVTTKAKNTPPPDALTIPAIANVKNFIVRYQSDVCVTNTSGQAIEYEINFVPTGLPGITEGQSAHVDIASGATLALNDIVATWFGGLSSSGTLEVRPLTDIAVSASAPASGLENRTTFASSRTFVVTSDGGTYGQYIPAIPYTDFVAKGSVLSLQQIAQSERYHTNLGLVEGSGEPVSLQVRIFDATGAKRGDFNVDLTGGQHTQLNDVLKEHGITLDDGRIEVEVTSGAGKVTAYASVIENEANDPLLVPPVTINGAGSSKWVVPGVAGFSGGSSNWQTDVRIFNAGKESVDLTLAFYSRSGGSAVTRTTTLAGGEVRQLNHMLSSFFGISQDAGALHIASGTAARLVVTARTYNETGQGAYGQFIAAVTPEESVSAGSRPLQILQVEESAHYRSNIGFAEVSGKAVTLEVSVFQPNHNDASIVEVKLAPNEFRQIDSLLSTLGLTEVYNARISVRAIDGEGRATAYLSLIDMKTGDPTYIPGQ